MPTFKRTNGSPLSVTYRNPEKLNQVASVTASVQPVRRDKASYNHIKKKIRVADVVKVETACQGSCLTSPVVLELSWSAPEGVPSDTYKQVLLKLISQNGGVDGIFVAGDETVTVD